jgi:hypothetical protein
VNSYDVTKLRTLVVTVLIIVIAIAKNQRPNVVFPTTFLSLSWFIRLVILDIDKEYGFNKNKTSPRQSCALSPLSLLRRGGRG